MIPQNHLAFGQVVGQADDGQGPRGKPFGDGFEVVRGPEAGVNVVLKPGPDLVDGQQVKERTDG